MRMLYEIVEVDRDYNAYVSSEWKEFKNRSEAEMYAHDQTWSGYSYSVGVMEREIKEEKKTK